MKYSLAQICTATENRSVSVLNHDWTQHNSLLVSLGVPVQGGGWKQPCTSTRTGLLNPLQQDRQLQRSGTARRALAWCRLRASQPCWRIFMARGSCPISTGPFFFWSVDWTYYNGRRELDNGCRSASRTAVRCSLRVLGQVGVGINVSCQAARVMGVLA